MLYRTYFIITLILFPVLYSCSATPQNWTGVTEFVTVSPDSDFMELEGYPPFEVEIFDNPFFEGSPQHSGTSTDKQYSFGSFFTTTNPGEPFYIRVKSSFGEWTPYRSASGSPQMIMGVPGFKGTPTNPHLLETKEDLLALSHHDTVRFGSVPWYSSYVLTDNIDITGIVWTPVGRNLTNSFRGRFNGAGYKVTGLEKMNPGDVYAGFFGFTSTSAQIKNLGIQIDNWVCNEASQIGGLSGYSVETVIKNCFVSGTKISTTQSGNPTLGGFIGVLADSDIDNCYTDIDVSGTGFTGGFIGRTSGSAPVGMDNCYAAGDVSYTGTGTHRVGGFFGQLAFGMYYPQNSLYLGSRVENLNNSSGTLSFFGNTYAVTTVYPTYYNKKIYSNGGNNQINTDVPPAVAKPINPFTMNKNSPPFNDPSWDFTDDWKWEHSINRPLLRKVRM